MMQRKRRANAFTLIEMLLVIVIIGVLAGMVITSLSGRSQEARVARAQSDIRGQLSLALDMYEQDTGRYPTQEEGLTVLVDDPGVTEWKGPYLKGGLKDDPWGQPYRYTLESSEAGRTRYILASAGPDGQFGTEDDI